MQPNLQDWCPHEAVTQPIEQLLENHKLSSVNRDVSNNLNIN